MAKPIERRSLIMATIAAALALLPLSFYGLVGAHENGSMSPISTQSVNAIIEETFSSQVVNGQRVRKELNQAMFWFADPADAIDCFASGSVPNEPLDGD